MDQDAGLDLVRTLSKIGLFFPPVMCRNLPCSRGDDFRSSNGTCRAGSPIGDAYNAGSRETASNIGCERIFIQSGEKKK